MNSQGDQSFVLLVFLVVALAIVFRRKVWRGSGTAFGTAKFCTRAMLVAAGMLRGPGLVFGRTLQRRELIMVKHPCHSLIVGGTGTGKTRGIIIPNLLTGRHPCVVVDVKSDLYTASASRRRRMGHKIVRLALLENSKDKLNPLDFISTGLLLTDQAKALAESLIVRQGTEPDMHWNDSASMVIAAVIVFVLLTMDDKHRNLNSVKTIVSESALLDEVAIKLSAMGTLREGVPARMGGYLQGLQDKERSSILSTCCRHLSFLDSELVAKIVACSSFDPTKIADGIDVYIQIPPKMLLSHAGLLRCWMQTLVNCVCDRESSREVYFVIDEASAVDNLPALQEALVRGRSGGCRLILAYQSDAQVKAAFKDKPTLIYDNCSTSLYLGASGLETAERISQMLGNQTIIIETVNDGTSSSRPRGWHKPQGDAGQVTRTEGRNLSEKERALLTTSEILSMSTSLLFAFVQGMNPIIARKLKWDQDAAFNPKVRVRWFLKWLFRAVLVFVLWNLFAH